MATIVHNKVATFPDDPAVEINKGEWNDNHALTLGANENFVTDAEKLLIGAFIGSIPIVTVEPALEAGKLVLFAFDDGGTTPNKVLSLKFKTPSGNVITLGEVQE